jgi:hypothetical protein
MILLSQDENHVWFCADTIVLPYPAILVQSRGAKTKEKGHLLRFARVILATMNKIELMMLELVGNGLPVTPI